MILSRALRGPLSGHLRVRETETPHAEVRAFASLEALQETGQRGQA